MTESGHEVSFGDYEYILELVVMVAQFCKYTKNYRIVHLQRVNLCYVNYISITQLLKKTCRFKRVQGEEREINKHKQLL